MAFNFNGPYSYPLNSTGAFNIGNAFNTNGTPRIAGPFNAVSVTTPAALKVTSQGAIPHTNGNPAIPLFNNNPVYPGQQYCENVLQFGGMSNPFTNQNQPVQFGGVNWNYGYPGGLEHFNRQLHQNMNCSSDVKSSNPSNIEPNSSSTKPTDTEKTLNKECVDGNSSCDKDVVKSKDTDQMSQEIAMKVSTMLSDPSILQNAISHIQSSKDICNSNSDIKSVSDNYSSDTDCSEDGSVKTIIPVNGDNLSGLSIGSALETVT